MVATFLILLSKLHTVFHRDCANFYPHQQCTRVPFSLHPLQHLFLTLIIAVVMSVRWYLITVWFALPLYLVKLNIFSYFCWLSICLFDKSACQVLCLSLIGLFVFMSLSYMSSNFGYQTLSLVLFANIFSRRRNAKVTCLYGVHAAENKVHAFVSGWPSWTLQWRYPVPVVSSRH